MKQRGGIGVAFLLLAILAMTPIATAETTDCPQISDARGDVVSHNGAPASLPMLSPAADIVSGCAWFDEAGSILAAVEVDDLSVLSDVDWRAGGSAQFSFFFSQVGDQQARFRLGATFGAAGWDFQFNEWENGVPVNATIAEGRADLSNSVVYVEILDPRFLQSTLEELNIQTLLTYPANYGLVQDDGARAAQTVQVSAPADPAEPSEPPMTSPDERRRTPGLTLIGAYVALGLAMMVFVKRR